MSFWRKVKVILSDIWAFLEPFVKLFLSKAGELLASAAMEAVVIVADNFGDADGDTKRKEAFKIIVDKLAVAGVVLGTSTINAAIEAAVAKLKSDG